MPAVAAMTRPGSPRPRRPALWRRPLRPARRRARRAASTRMGRQLPVFTVATTQSDWQRFDVPVPEGSFDSSVCRSSPVPGDGFARPETPLQVYGAGSGGAAQSAQPVSCRLRLGVGDRSVPRRARRIRTKPTSSARSCSPSVGVQNLDLCEFDEPLHVGHACRDCGWCPREAGLQQRSRRRSADRLADGVTLVDFAQMPSACRFGRKEARRSAPAPPRSS